MAKATRRIREIEKDLGVRYLSHEEVEILKPLTDTRRIEIASEQSEALEEVVKLEAELKEIREKYKGKITENKESALELARTINRGKEGSVGRFPIFYDHSKKRRIAVDTETGEIVQESAASSFDAQQSLPLEEEEAV